MFFVSWAGPATKLPGTQQKVPEQKRTVFAGPRCPEHRGPFSRLSSCGCGVSCWHRTKSHRLQGSKDLKMSFNAQTEVHAPSQCLGGSLLRELVPRRERFESYRRRHAGVVFDPVGEQKGTILCQRDLWIADVEAEMQESRLFLDLRLSANSQATTGAAGQCKTP